MTDEPFSCDECHADFEHRPDCSRRLPEKPIGCPQCGLLGDHARGCAEALRVSQLPALQALPRAHGAPPAAYIEAVPRHGRTGRGLRAFIPEEETPPLAQQEIVDRVISTLIAEDARARSCLPPSPQGYHWDAALDVRPNGSAAQGEVRLRIAYRLVEDE